MPFKINLRYTLFFFVLVYSFTRTVSAQKFIDDFKVTPFKLPIETKAHDILEDSYGFV